MIKKVFVLLGWLACFGGILTADIQRIDVQYYLMPDNHPAKKALDTIFSPAYALASPQSMKRAGFFLRLRSDPRKLIAAKHPFLPDYIIKAYLDTHSEIDEEWKYLVDRIIGARIIQESIEDNHYNHLMKVPKKWIYALPNPGRRKYVLVAENMNLMSPAKNAACYLKKMNKERLAALFVLLKENLLIDSVYISNIPFCTDGKIAFIDTEHFHTMAKPVPYEMLLPKLSREMQDYWNTLIREYR